MRWWIAIGCVLCACSNSGALEVVVEMDPAIAVDRVQLYVGLGGVQNEQRELLVPSEYRYPERPNGFYWKRDPKGANDVVDVDPGAADVRFTFHEGTHDKLTLVVVGYLDGNVVAATSLVDARIEASTVSQYHVKLKPATNAVVKPRATITVHRWGPGPDDTQCVYLEDPSTEERGIYIVEHDDRDCDGFADEADNECRANVWRGRLRPQAQKTTCLGTDTVIGPNNTSVTTCVLGGVGCSDGTGTTQCEPSTVCVQPHHCASCATRPDALECMAQLPATSATITRIECVFYVEATATALCGGDALLTPPLALPVGCDPMQPFHLFAEEGGWKPSLITTNGMTFGVAMPTPACELKLSAVNIGVPAIGGYSTLVMYPLANGRHAAVPLQITIKSATGMGCADPINTNKCFVEGEAPSAPFLACMRSDVIEPW